jgi:hypothetical protein
VINKLKLLVGVLFLVGFFNLATPAQAKTDYDCYFDVESDSVQFCVSDLESQRVASGLQATLTCNKNCEPFPNIYRYNYKQADAVQNSSNSWTVCRDMTTVFNNAEKYFEACLAKQKNKDECFPKFTGNIVIKNGTGASSCRGTLTPDLDATDYTLDDYDSSTEFGLCKQVNDSALQADCYACLGCAEQDKECQPKGIWTAVGCIPVGPDKEVDMIKVLITIGLGVAGGIALLIIIVSAFMLTVSQGDPQKTSEAKDQLTAAIIGLFFIIFSVTVLQFIGVQIFRIPGFGQ